MSYAATHRLNPEHLRRNEMSALLRNAARNAETQRDHSHRVFVGLVAVSVALGAALAFVL